MHSNIGPSSAERWFNCPGSVLAISAVPVAPGSSVHAAEGTVAHWLCEQFVTGKMTLKQLMAKAGTVVQQDGFDIEVTDEMVDAVIDFNDIIQADIKELSEFGKVEWFAESRLYAKSVDEKLFGTTDFVAFVRGKFLCVYDFKYGKGVAVEAEKNKQMAIYALAAMDTHKLEALSHGVELVIIQPRAGGVKRWRTTYSWVRGQFKSEVKAAVEATREPIPELKAGKWCRWCPAAPTCPKAFAEAQQQAMVDFAEPPTNLAKGVLPDIKSLPVEVMVRALEHEDFVSSWFEAIRVHLKQLLEAGISVPGLKLVEGKTNRKWSDEKQVIKELSPLFGEEALFEKKLLSPAKLEKIVGKGKLDHLTFKPEGSKSLAPESDPRPAARAKAELDFTPVPAALPTKDALLEELETVPATKPKEIWPK